MGHPSRKGFRLVEFEFARNITIGQYIPGASVIHRLDPRAKIIATVILAAAFAATRSVIGTLLLIGAILLLVRLAGIPIGYALRGLLPSLSFLIFLLLVQLLYQGWREPAGRVYFEWGWLRFTRFSVHLVVLAALRFSGYLILLSLLTLTTTAGNLTHGLEILASPLRYVGLPVRELSIMYMIALRFVPTLASDLERIAKAQASRGGGIGQQNFWRPDLAARARLPLIVPLFLSALQRAEDLVLAMEARGFVSGARRTKFVQLRLTALDPVAVLGSLCIYFSLRQFPWPPLHQLLAGL
jgi:energy-coupling factor transport system permease protein